MPIASALEPLRHRPSTIRRRTLRRLLLLALNVLAIGAGYFAFGFSLVQISSSTQAGQIPATAGLFLLEFIFCVVSVVISHYYLSTSRHSRAYMIALAPTFVFVLLILLSL